MGGADAARMEGVQSLSVKRTIYQALKYHGDYDAVRMNQVPRRVGRRIFGR